MENPRFQWSCEYLNPHQNLRSPCATTPRGLQWRSRQNGPGHTHPENPPFSGEKPQEKGGFYGIVMGIHDGIFMVIDVGIWPATLGILMGFTLW